TLCACKNIAAGRPMLLPMWFQPLKVIETRKRLFTLGFAYLAFCMAGGFLATLPFMDNLMSALDSDGAINEQALMAAMRGPFITFGLLYVLISALFWHAPALIGWHHIKMTQALFFSMVACWRNKLPFLVYGAIWAAIFFAIQMVGSFITTMGISPGAVQVLVTHLNIVVAAVL